jgi:hypothetical protein
MRQRRKIKVDLLNGNSRLRRQTHPQNVTCPKQIQHQPYAENFDWIFYYRVLGFLLLVSVELEWTEL